jgi:hypothetical protein
VRIRDLGLELQRVSVTPKAKSRRGSRSVDR